MIGISVIFENKGNIMERITIVYASDEEFLLQTHVSIYSVLKSRKKKYAIDFYILVPEGTIVINKNGVWDFQDFLINYIEISNKFFSDNKMTISHITKPTYYRLLIPRLFSNLDKVIYLDGDTLCFKDIIYLYNENIDNYYIGGCRGELINWSNDTAEYIKSRLKINSADNFINAGVLIMNIPLLKEIAELLVLESKNNYPEQDQDVINKCCYERIKILHPKYNLYSWTKNLYTVGQCFRYDLKFIEEAINTPYIIHFANEYTKPWRNDKCIMFDLWWQYANKALSEYEFNQMKAILKRNICRLNNEELNKVLNNNDEVIIWGCGEAGKEYSKYLSNKYGNKKIKFFCDNDVTKCEMLIDEKKVYTLDKVKEYKDLPIIITVQNSMKEIKQQLLENGINEKRIFFYNKKGDSYYYSLNCID